MVDTGPERTRRSGSLTAAIRAARLDEAERSQAVGGLRGVELARLDLLHEALVPVLAQVPAEIELFDAGVVPGEHPRLFVDMIAFVEMARDRRTYRFLQDTRHGRVLLAESDAVTAMTDTITHYIARRLVEREKTLASLLEPPRPEVAPPKGPAAKAAPAPAPSRRDPSPGRPPAAVALARGARLGVDALGVLALGALVWMGVQYLLGRGNGW